MDPVEVKVVQDVFVKHFINKVDGLELAKHLYFNKYIDKVNYRSVLTMWHNSTLNNVDKTIRVINMIVSQITFATFHQILSRHGLGDVAHLLSYRLVLQKSVSHVVRRINKLPMGQRQLLYRIFVKVKSMADFGSLRDPGADVRRVSIVFKHRFESVTDPLEKQQKANMYFTILLSELDNTSFITSTYTTYRALLRELEAVIPYTTNPALNRAVVLSRKASVNGRLGRLQQGNNDAHSALVLALEYETGPDLCSILHEQANLLYSEFEKMPTTGALRQLREVCFRGIRVANELQGAMNELGQLFKVHFYTKIALCSLGLDLHGQPLEGFNVNEDNRAIAHLCLDSLGHGHEYATMRRTMFTIIARGRLDEIKGNYGSARESIVEAHALAVKGQFDERWYLEDYLKQLERRCKE